MTTPRAPTIAIWCGQTPRMFGATVACLGRSLPAASVLIGYRGADTEAAEIVELTELPVQRVELACASDLFNLAGERGVPVLAVLEPIVAAPGFCDRALDALASDLTIAVVSFLSNAAGYLSLPYRNTPVDHRTSGLDEFQTLSRLRSLQPELPLLPVPLPVGPLALVSYTALTAVGPLLDAPSGDGELAIAEFGLRCLERGFGVRFDPGSFVLRTTDVGPLRQSALEDSDARHWLHLRHPSFPVSVEEAADGLESPVAVGLRLARVKAQGLRLVIDGTCLGPTEMGTQVNAISMIAALAAEDEVASIVVAMPGPSPAYAGDTLAHPKISTVMAPGAILPDDVRGDVLHRTFQPDRPLPIENWRRCAGRIVVTMQDLISYRNCAYHASPEAWLRYRESVRDACAAVDAVITISDSVRQELLRELLPIDAERITPILCGTDHLSGQRSPQMPRMLATAGWAARPYGLVLGTNYLHKNRDLAIAAVATLRETGRDIGLILVGAHVPHGSTRLREVVVGSFESDVLVLPEVGSAERDWLLEQAAFVLYPTSAEGFGLVPFEAARFGTPTVFVPFGPLLEAAGRPVVTADDWSPAGLAIAVASLLDNPDLARAQVESVLAAGSSLSWTLAAQQHCATYRAVLGRPRCR